MKTAIKQGAITLGLSALLLTSPIAIASPVECEIGQTCQLGLSTEAVFPITESGTYTCSIEFHGTNVALDEHEAVAVAGKNTSFTTTTLDITGDDSTSFNALVSSHKEGEILIKSSADTLYFSANAECNKATQQAKR